MASDSFKFKQFSVVQSRSAMKVGTDGVLLGAWATEQCQSLNPKKVLDVGSGTGVVSLIVAQRCSMSQITAVEVDEDAAQESVFNFEQSSWSDRLAVVTSTFQSFSCLPSCERSFDMVISNPPYFIDSLKNESQKKVAARHALLLPYKDMVEGVDRVLSDDGELYLILPYEQSAIFIALAAVQGLVLRRRVDVRGGYGKPLKRSLLKFSRSKGEMTTSQLVIEGEQRGDYTQKYRELTSDLYLKF